MSLLVFINFNASSLPRRESDVAWETALLPALRSGDLFGRVFISLDSG